MALGMSHSELRLRCGKGAKEKAGVLFELEEATAGSEAG